MHVTEDAGPGNCPQILEESTHSEENQIRGPRIKQV